MAEAFTKDQATNKSEQDIVTEALGLLAGYKKQLQRDEAAEKKRRHDERIDMLLKKVRRLIDKPSVHRHADEVILEAIKPGLELLTETVPGDPVHVNGAAPVSHQPEDA